MNDCEYCKEGRNGIIREVKVVYEYEDPYARGFPEVCFWNKVYQTNGCPICGRKLENVEVEE